MAPKPFQPVVELTRGETAESVHFGVVAVVDLSGKLIASYGDPNRVAFLRSTAKPFQALPFIEAAGHTHYQMTAKEIAVICASHSGTKDHVKTITALQEKIGITESHLMCGSHPPFHAQTAKEMVLRRKEPTQLHHNCSGKHTGMLAFAKLIDAPLDSYLEHDHPIQQRILDAFSEMCCLEIEEIALGIDGCSAPNFATPIYHAARGWVNLVDPSQLSERRANACRIITDAMIAHPEMVAGPERFDTALMRAGGGRILSKAGAEGYQGIGLMPGALGEHSPGLGISIKISDGDLRGTVRPVVVLEVLRQFGLLDAQMKQDLVNFGPVREIKNWRNLVVGEIRPVFNLDKK
jgi:L-asparaginase II